MLNPEGLKILLMKYHKGREVYYRINLYLRTKDVIMIPNKWIIDYLKKFNLSGLQVFKDMSIDHARANNRIRNVKYLLGYKLHATRNKIMDLGTGDGLVALKLANVYAMDSTYYSLEVGKDERCADSKYDPRLDFRLYDGKKIPDDITELDLVTMFMVIHHVPEKYIDDLLSSVYQSMAKGGFVVIREHDVKSPSVEALVHVQHYIMNTIYSKTAVCQEEKCYEKLYSRNELINLFVKHGFKSIYRGGMFKGNRKNITKYIYCVFEKV